MATLLNLTKINGLMKSVLSHFLVHILKSPYLLVTFNWLEISLIWVRMVSSIRVLRYLFMIEQIWLLIGLAFRFIPLLCRTRCSSIVLELKELLHIVHVCGLTLSSLLELRRCLLVALVIFLLMLPLWAMLELKV